MFATTDEIRRGKKNENQFWHVFLIKNHDKTKIDETQGRLNKLPKT
jgi:hypothetical protein